MITRVDILRILIRNDEQRVREFSAAMESKLDSESTLQGGLMAQGVRAGFVLERHRMELEQLSTGAAQSLPGAGRPACAVAGPVTPESAAAKSNTSADSGLESQPSVIPTGPVLAKSSSPAAPASSTTHAPSPWVTSGEAQPGIPS